MSFWRKRSKIRVESTFVQIFLEIHCEQKELHVSRGLQFTSSLLITDTQCDLSSAPRIPFSEAKVTRCSVFAVICRLKSYTYSTHGRRKRDFICRVPEYPDVTVTIPASVVQKNGDFQLTLKV